MYNYLIDGNRLGCRKALGGEKLLMGQENAAIKKGVKAMGMRLPDTTVTPADCADG